MFPDTPWYGFLFLLLPLAYVTMPVVVLYFAYRFLRAYERRGVARDAEAQLRERVAALEDEVARLALQHDRLADGQRFTNALLTRDGTHVRADTPPPGTT
jgi:hypothetical protein